MTKLALAQIFEPICTVLVLMPGVLFGVAVLVAQSI